MPFGAIATAPTVTEGPPASARHSPFDEPLAPPTSDAGIHTATFALTADPARAKLVQHAVFGDEAADRVEGDRVAGGLQKVRQRLDLGGVMALPMTVWTECNGIGNNVLSSLCQRNDVVDF